MTVLKKNIIENASAAAGLSVNNKEIANFSMLADEWWKEDGAFSPLHTLNPCRCEFIRNEISKQYGLSYSVRFPYKGLSFLDVGCGGGILCEPLARLGGKVTGIDASEKGIDAARRHAEESSLEIEYRCDTAENTAKAGKFYDVVTALEIIEHVDDFSGFVSALTQTVKPGGMLFISTVNRTVRSYAAAIIGAEYILRWVPQGTHEWNRFFKPHEITGEVTKQGFDTVSAAGMIYNPFNRSFSLNPRDMSVNYIICFRRRKS